MDKDGNGVISTSEIEQLPGPFRDRLMQSGMDFNRGVRVEEMTQNFQRQMEERRQQQDAGGDQRGGFGRDRGSRREERADRPEIPQQQEPRPEEGRDNRGYGSSRGGATSSTSTPSTTSASGSGSNSNSRSRISPYLPDTYKSLDTDFDGQIALYEWRKGKRGTISQFAQYDLNGDGFLIARELASVAIASPTEATSTSAPPAAPTAAAPVAPVPVSVEAAEKANRAFELLDSDKSGTVQGTEWDKSIRLKPLFEKGGVDLNLPLTKDQFTQAFVRVGADK